MTTRAVCATAGLACALVAPAVVRPQDATPADDAALARRIEAYVAPFALHDLSGTLLVARGSRILLERSFGYANYELKVPFAPNTPTNIASITKPLTIIITARLAEEKRLSVNDTVSKWVPEYVYGSRMTVEQLLNHEAGVPHRLLADDAQGEPRTTADMVRAANALPLLFEPGAKSEYSSGGYAILAAVLERTTGKTYDELLQEYVARPVGAGTIRSANLRDVLAGRASSLMSTGTGMLNGPLHDLSFLVGGGSVYSTPRDILAVMRGVLAGTYGAGARTALVRDNGLEWSGLTNGFRAFADFRKRDSLFVLFFGNAHTGAIDLMRRAVLHLAAGEEVAAARVPSVTPASLSAAAQARLEGSYDTGGGAASRAAFLSPSMLLLGDRILLPVNDSTFISLADYAPVTFTSGPSGLVEAIQWGPGTWGTGEMGPRFVRLKNATR